MGKVLWGACCLFALTGCAEQAMLPRAEMAPSGPYLLSFSAEPPPIAKILEAFQADYPTRAGPGMNCTIKIDRKLPPESYQVNVTKGIVLRAGSEKGLVWGLQKLRKLAASGERPAEVKDAPAWEFRAVSLDVARRYHSVETLRQLIRASSLARVPYISLHLTDDQNWMFPSRVVPTAPLRNRHRKPAYTRAELQELADYARVRGVTLIPEIDVPGHSAILCRIDRRWRFPGSDNCINFRSGWVREQVAKMFDEVIQVFPNSPYIHIGGDEAMYPHSAANDAALVEFIGELSDRILKKGRTPLIWEGFPRSEYAKQRISKKVRIISWTMDNYRPDHLVADGFQIINACWDPCYVVGHYQSDAFTLAPLPRLYKIDPTVFGRMSNEARRLNSKRGIAGSMLCWWEGKEEHALRVLPERILAFGARLWAPNLPTPYPEFATQSGRELGLLLPGRPQYKPNKVANSRSDDPQFSADALIDGDATTPSRHWIGYPLPASATLDLGSARHVSTARVVPFFAAGQRTQYVVSLSLDQKKWSQVASSRGAAPTSAGFTHTFEPQKARYARLTVTSSDQHPPGVGRVHEFSVR